MLIFPWVVIASFPDTSRRHTAYPRFASGAVPSGDTVPERSVWTVSLWKQVHPDLRIRKL